MKTKAIGYVRVSTEGQAERGVSLDAQAEKLRVYASLYDIEIVRIEVDAGVSGKTLRRDGLQRALDSLRSGEASALLVAKLDRLTRSVVDLGALLVGPFAADRFSLLSVGEQIDTRTAAGRLVLNVLASVSQWEREAIGERTSTALQHKRSRGERVGQVPYGFAVAPNGVDLVELPQEQATIARVLRLAGDGVSQRGIAEDLNSAAVPARGSKWHPTTVARLVKRHRLAA